MSVNAGDRTGTIKVDVGAVKRSERIDGSVASLNLEGLTAIIDIEDNTDQFKVTNLSVGDGPLRVDLDNSELLSLDLEPFGFTAREQNGELVPDGALSMEAFYNNILGDTTARLSYIAPALAGFTVGAAYEYGDPISLSTGGPLTGVFSNDGSPWSVATGECFQRKRIGARIAFDSPLNVEVVPVACGEASFDADADGILDNIDNCPFTRNVTQTDSDNDSNGDACDNCPVVSNSDQVDMDDETGDACDPDIDGDNIDNSIDNCPVTSNQNQANLDNDGLSDSCDNSNDTDTDNDGVLDTADNCPMDPNADQENLDGDRFGCVCEDDRDGDGVANNNDNCAVYPNPGQGDFNNDGIGNHCECKFTAEIEALGPWQDVDKTDLTPIPGTVARACQQVNIDNSTIAIFDYSTSPDPFRISYFEFDTNDSPMIGNSQSLDGQRSCALLLRCDVQ